MGIMTREELREAVGSGIVQVIFTKKDGTERCIDCTTNPDIIEDLNITFDRHAKQLDFDPDLFRVIDVELEEWRSFKYEQITKTRIFLDV